MTLLTPTAVTWRYLGDIRFPIVLGRAFLLQVMHPTVAAGVAEHSRFKSDPWGRLHRSWRPVLRTVYGPDGHVVGARVRARHERIGGVMRDGRRYHAFEPDAYWWVLATGLDSMFVFASRLGQPLVITEQRAAVDEVRELGRRLGLRDQDMPANLEAFRRSFDETVVDVLTDSEPAQDLLGLLKRLPPPPAWPGWLWSLPRSLAGHIAWLATAGTLPARARDLLGIRWSARQEAELCAVADASRLFDHLPPLLRSVPIARAAKQAALAPHHTRSTT